jgi:hypothetical protein
VRTVEDEDTFSVVNWLIPEVVSVKVTVVAPSLATPTICNSVLAESVAVEPVFTVAFDAAPAEATPSL